VGKLGSHGWRRLQSLLDLPWGGGRSASIWGKTLGGGGGKGGREQLQKVATFERFFIRMGRRRGADIKRRLPAGTADI